MVMGLCVHRWEETGLPRLGSVGSLESLVNTVLEETVGRPPALKTLTKPTPPILCDKELVAEVRDHMVTYVIIYFKGTVS